MDILLERTLQTDYLIRIRLEYQQAISSIGLLMTTHQC